MTTTSTKSVTTKKVKADNKLKKRTGDNKDRSKLIFNGKKYGKRRVVQAVIEKYLSTHPNITSKQLEEVFPNTLSALGLFQTLNVAKKKSTNHKRYFLDEPIQLKDKKMAICSEFGKDNIGAFLKHADKLGLHVETKMKYAS